MVSLQLAIFNVEMHIEQIFQEGHADLRVVVRPVQYLHAALYINDVLTEVLSD